MNGKKVLWFAAVGAAAALGAVFFVRRGVDKNNQHSTLRRSPSYGGQARSTHDDANQFVSSSPSVEKPAPVLISSQEELAEMELSDELKTLLGLTDKPASYKDRNKVLRNLYSNKNFSAEELLALRSLLDFPLSDFSNMRPIEANALKNDALAMLLEQEILPVGIDAQMIDMLNNPDHDSVWQDYCVQFMPTLYERMQEQVESEKLKEDESQSVASVDSIQSAMESALDRRDSTVAGTALIGLELLSRTNDEFDQEMITEKAVEISEDESASASSRLTAMRMASMLENEEVLSSARMLAQTGETVLLQCAAITTLGDFGSEEDLELLESLSQSSNKQIASAAQSVLEKM